MDAPGVAVSVALPAGAGRRGYHRRVCGRFSFASPPEVAAQVFGVAASSLGAPRYNIAPTQEVAIVRWHEGGRRLGWAHWGLIPAWARDRSLGARLINARAETAADKPAFRGAFKARRCLVPADGFYEWVHQGRGKQPYFIAFRDGRPFAFAGLWERWGEGGETVESCTILTTTPNEVVAPLHDRMPVIVPAEHYQRWLDPELRDVRLLQPLLRPHPAHGMVAWPVSPRVNNPRFDDPACRAPVTPSR